MVPGGELGTIPQSGHPLCQEEDEEDLDATRREYDGLGRTFAEKTGVAPPALRGDSGPTTPRMMRLAPDPTATLPCSGKGAPARSKAAGPPQGQAPKPRYCTPQRVVMTPRRASSVVADHPGVVPGPMVAVSPTTPRVAQASGMPWQYQVGPVKVLRGMDVYKSFQNVEVKPAGASLQLPAAAAASFQPPPRTGPSAGSACIGGVPQNQRPSSAPRVRPMQHSIAGPPPPVHAIPPTGGSLVAAPGSAPMAVAPGGGSLRVARASTPMRQPSANKVMVMTPRASTPRARAPVTAAQGPVAGAMAPGNS